MRTKNYVPCHNSDLSSRLSVHERSPTVAQYANAMLAGTLSRKLASDVG